MSILTKESTVLLWQDTIKHAESRSAILLPDDLEFYLISLLIRYTSKPAFAEQVLATLFLEALQLRVQERNISMQHVGDACLLLAGLFPHIAAKRQVKIRYFVDLGRSAYGTISHTANDLYSGLSLQFVGLMDVLQAIPNEPTLLPLEAYEQWREVGSQYALQTLRLYTKGTPHT